MASYNKAIFLGNLTRDPDMLSTHGGKPGSSFCLAVSEKYRDKSGREQEATDFWDIEVWGALAATCNEYLHKGDRVLAEGRLTRDTWENKQGEKRSKVKLKASTIKFLKVQRKGA